MKNTLRVLSAGKTFSLKTCQHIWDKIPQTVLELEKAQQTQLYRTKVLFKKKQQQQAANKPWSSFVTY